MFQSICITALRHYYSCTTTTTFTCIYLANTIFQSTLHVRQNAIQYRLEQLTTLNRLYFPSYLDTKFPHSLCCKIILIHLYVHFLNSHGLVTVVRNTLSLNLEAVRSVRYIKDSCKSTQSLVFSLVGAHHRPVHTGFQPWS